MSFNEAAVDALLSAIASEAKRLPWFESAAMHEPQSAPGAGLRLAVWADYIKPVISSGLSATSGLVTFMARIYSSAITRPLDDIDPQLLKATSALMGALTGDFDFGGVADVRSIDLIGQHSDGLSAQAGYLEQDGKLYRVMVISLPVIVNDLWTQESGA